MLVGVTKSNKYSRSNRKKISVGTAFFVVVDVGGDMDTFHTFGEFEKWLVELRSKFVRQMTTAGFGDAGTLWQPVSTRSFEPDARCSVNWQPVEGRKGEGKGGRGVVFPHFFFTITTAHQ